MDKATFYFNRANTLSAHCMYAEAIKAYNKSIELNPTALAYYNRRNAMDQRKKVVENIPLVEDNKDIRTIIQGLRQLSVPSTPTNFVISTIACVLKDEFSGDSSSEEEDGTFPEEMFNLQGSMPFTTRKCSRNATESVEDRPNGQGTSFVITPLLQKLSENGFEKNDKDKLEYVSVSIGLNMMKSLSTRKNALLLSELENNVATRVRYEKFGFYWKCNWYSPREKKYVKYEEVRKFYKQLKRINPDKAKKFIEEIEKNVSVPYQKLREYAKNHAKTKKLVNEFRDKISDTNVFFSLIDSDTVDFNGCYSAYLRIVANSSKIPTIMTTGYEFPALDKDEGGAVYQFASQIDRMVRVKTTYLLPLGVYYPEPNMCVLIPQENDTLPESFINNKKKGESSSLLIAIQQNKNRENVTSIFSEDKPLITSIPPRAKLTKSHKTPITFSLEFTEGASPTGNDFRSCKQVAQSHFHENVWYKNLFINDPIKNRSTLARIVHLLSEIRNPKENTDKDKTMLELKQYIDSDVFDAIVKTIAEVNRYVKQHEIEYVRSEEEKKLLDILAEHDIILRSFRRETLLVLAQTPALELIEDLIDDENMEALEFLCNDEEILEILKNENKFDSLSCLLDEENLSHCIRAREKHSMEEILERFEDDPIYVKFMALDETEMTDFVYENLHNDEFAEFAIRNYEIDVDFIRSQLNEGREPEDSSDLVHFDIISGRYDEDLDEDYYDEEAHQQM